LTALVLCGSSAAAAPDERATNPAWKKLPSMAIPAVFAAAAAGVDGRIYVLGGQTNYDSSTSLTTTRIFDPKKGAWTEGASMPTARSCPGAATGPDGRIYVMGGQIQRQALDTVEAYDPRKNSWMRCSPMPSPRTDPSIVAAWDGSGQVRIYSIGGRDFRAPGNGLATVEAYDPVTDTWSTKTAMPTLRHAQTEAVSSAGLIYVIGGAHNLGQPKFLSTVEVYDPARDKWSVVEPLPYRVECAMAAGAGGEILVFGGWKNLEKDETRSVLAFNPRSSAWRHLPDMPTARAAGNAVSLQEADSTDHIYLLGGKDSEVSVEEYVIPRAPEKR